VLIRVKFVVSVLKIANISNLFINFCAKLKYLTINTKIGTLNTEIGTFYTKIGTFYTKIGTFYTKIGTFCTVFITIFFVKSL